MAENDRSGLEAKWEAAAAAAEKATAADGGGADTPTGDADPELGERDAEIARLTDQLLRQRAEMANYRRRVERDQDDSLRDTKAALVRALLPVMDDFERATSAGSTDFAAYREGVELILREMREVLAGYGVTPIEPRGLPFDPELHEAVENAETDTVPPGNVAEVFSVGYELDGRLVRPATVSVARLPADSGESDG